MAFSVEVLREDERWQSVGLAGLADVACGAVLVHMRHVGDFEVSVLGCDDARIAVLNGDFRGKSAATNVLSWPGAEFTRAAGQHPVGQVPAELGDIAIAYETCEREAAAQGKKLDDHVTHLLVHACLHLLGYDHIEDTDADLMERLEVEILGNLSISDPYRDTGQ